MYLDEISKDYKFFFEEHRNRTSVEKAKKLTKLLISV